jgi:hypothetical protein
LSTHPPPAECSPRSCSPPAITDKSMPNNDKPQKVNIGFDGGQVLSARVAPDELSKLRSALGGNGWHELTAEDGTVALSLGSIVYVLVDHEEHRVGFGS